MSHPSHPDDSADSPSLPDETFARGADDRDDDVDVDGASADDQAGADAGAQDDVEALRASDSDDASDLREPAADDDADAASDDDASSDDDAEPRSDEDDDEDAGASGAAPIEAEAEVGAPSPAEWQARARGLDDERVAGILESLLLVSDRALPVETLADASGVDSERIARALAALTEQMRTRGAGMVLLEVAGGWQLRTAPENADYVRRFLQVKPQRLTRAALETLAIVAYRQPATRPEVEDIRGVDCGAVLKALLDRKLVKILGRKEEVGRPILYGTTREFLEFFGLRDLAALPTLREFQELSEEHREIVEEQAPPPLVADSVLDEALRKSEAESESALEELEQAISGADSIVRAASVALAPPAPPVEGVSASDTGAAVATAASIEGVSNDAAAAPLDVAADAAEERAESR